MGLISVDVSQLSKLGAALAAAPGRTSGSVAAVVRATAARIEADAKTACPVDTGNLRNSISTSTTGDGRSPAMTAEIGPTANYGGFVEYGTSRMSPQPYMRPAFDRRSPEFVAALEYLAGRVLNE